MLKDYMNPITNSIDRRSTPIAHTTTTVIMLLRQIAFMGKIINK